MRGTGAWTGLKWFCLIALVLLSALLCWQTELSRRSQAQHSANLQAAWLAQWLEALPGDPVLRDRSLAAQAQRQTWHRLRVLDFEGRALWDFAAGHPLPLNPPQAGPRFDVGEGPIGRSTAWLAVEPGEARSARTQVQVEIQPLAELPAWTVERLTAAASLLLAVTGLAVALQRRRALLDAVQTAAAESEDLLSGDFQRIQTPTLPELQPLVEVMNLMLGRLRTVFAASSEQVETLRLQAHTDALTGLANRRHFMARLESALDETSSTPELGLLLFRVRDLNGLDRRLGREAADQLLQSIAKTLQAYTRHVDGCTAGRLNGSDFALLLPVGGVAQDTALVLSKALRVSIVMIDPSASVAIGAAELPGTMPLGEAVALADEALAQAEADMAYGVAMATVQSHPRPVGEGEWRQRLIEALSQNRLCLQEAPVCGPDGRLLYLDCPLRVHTDADTDPVLAHRWLAFAHRSRLCPDLDERAVRLAIDAIAVDGRARCIHLTAPTLGHSAAMVAITRALEASPQSARRLWIDMPEHLALDHPHQIQEAARRWRPLGVSLGLERAGDGLARIASLMTLGVDFVRIDGHYLRRVSDADSDSARRHLQGLVRLVQAAGLSVVAEGVGHVADLEALWLLGFDAASGPAVEAGAMALDSVEA